MSIEYIYPSSSPIRTHEVRSGYERIDEPPSPASQTQQKKAIPAEEKAAWGEDGFGVDDFFDLINPLQHLPVISTLYREATGDTIQPGARIMGGGLFGGVVGVVSAGVNAVIDTATGADIGEHAIAMVGSSANNQQGHPPFPDTASPSADMAPHPTYAALRDLPPPPDLSPLRNVTLGIEAKKITSVDAAEGNVTLSIADIHTAANRYRAAVVRNFS